jgi:hypothetical protein
LPVLRGAKASGQRSTHLLWIAIDQVQQHPRRALRVSVTPLAVAQGGDRQT